MDESAGLGMTSLTMLSHHSLSCTASQKPLASSTPSRGHDGVMNDWSCGRRERKRGKEYTVANFVLCIFSHCYSKHANLLLLLYRRKQAHACRVTSFSLVIYAKEQWLISRSIIYRLLPSLNKPIMGVYVFVLL